MPSGKSLKQDLTRDLALQVLVNANGPLDAVEIAERTNLAVSVPDALNAIHRLREEGIAVNAEPDPIRVRYISLIH